MSLWTSIRDTVTGVVAKAAPTVIGTAIGGPVGGIIGNTLGNALLPMPSAPSMGAPTASPSAMPGSGGMVQTGATGTWGSLVGKATQWIIGQRGIVSTTAGRLLGVMKGTRLIRVKQIADLAKRVGLEATAAALGVTVVEVAQLIAAHLMSSAAKRKRGRGITGRDVRITRRTIHKIRSIEHSLSGLCHPRRATTRARSAGGTFVRQG